MKKSVSCAALTVLLCITVLLGGVSYSKYQMQFIDQIIGAYTHLYLSHNGDGQTAILSKQSDGTYVSYVELEVKNVEEDKISKRDIQFAVRIPTEEEISVGYVTDAWENELEVETTSKNYTDIALVDAYGKVLDEESAKQATFLEREVVSTTSLILKITRNAEEIESSDNSEYLTVVLETSSPYQDVRVFKILLTDRLVSANVVQTEYFGFTEVSVNINTKNYYKDEDSDKQVDSNLPVKLTFTLTDGVIFDYARFLTDVAGNYEQLTSDDAYTVGYYDLTKQTFVLFVPEASDITLHFYVEGTASIHLEARFKNSDNDFVEYTAKVAGIQQDGTVYSAT